MSKKMIVPPLGVKIYHPNVNCDMLGPIISENDLPFFAPWVTLAHKSCKNLKPCRLQVNRITIGKENSI